MKRVIKRASPIGCDDFALHGLEGRRLFNAALVADINTTVGRDYRPTNLAAIGDLVYFTQNDGVHGDELWRTDGTQAGSVMIKDIYPGIGSSSPGGFVRADDGTVFFVATDGPHGYELWKTNGTEAGTVLVKDFNAGFINTIPDTLTVVGNKVYFFADDGVHGRELWTSDGTTGGTQLVIDLHSGSSGQSGKVLAALNGNLYFYGDDGSKSGLWKSTGTIGNATLVKASLTAQKMAVFDGRIFLSDSSGYIWASDGTGNGTVTVQSINTASSNFVSTAGALFFSRASGSSAGVYRIGAGSTTPVSVGSGYTSPNWLSDVGGDLYFTAKVGTSTAGLYKVSQFDTTASLVLDLAPGNSQAFLSNLASLNGGLYLTLYTPAEHYSLWHEPLGFSAPVYVQTLEGGGVYAPTSFVGAGDYMIFANDDSTHGMELWSSQGIFGGTGIVQDTYPGTAWSDPFFSGQAGDRLFFRADDGVHGSEPMMLDSTGTITSLGDLMPGTQSSSPFGSTTLGDKTVFAATTASGREPWVTDGTAGGTMLLKDIYTGSSYSSPGNFIVYKDRIYFSAEDASHGTEMWVTDGTPGGTTLFKDFIAGTGSGGFASPMVYNGMLYFAAADTAGGTELWRTDGTAGGTSQVKDLRAGSSGSSPANFTLFNGMLYFTAQDASNGISLWQTDGTTTQQVSHLYFSTTGSSAPANLVAAGGYLYFTAGTGSVKQIWRTDGSDGGTIKLSDAALSPYGLVALRDRLYFFAKNAANGYDLWQSDGTTQTTVIVKAILPPPPAGLTPFTPNTPTVANGRLFFLGDDGTTGLELWSSDGTASGTALVQDLTPGTIQGVLGSQIAVFNGDVYVDGNDGVSGFEPYRFADEYPPVIWKGELSLNTAPAFAVTLNEAFVPPDPSDLVLMNITTGQRVAANMMAVSSDPAAHTIRLTFPGFAHGTPSDGNYVLTFGRHTLADVKGNQNEVDLSASFFVFAGDANRDRAINFADLVAVAQNYGGTGKTYAQGDFNFDGMVSFADLVTVAQKYGTVLLTPLPPPAPAAVAPATAVASDGVLAPVKEETPVIKAAGPATPVKEVSRPVFGARRIGRGG